MSDAKRKSRLIVQVLLLVAVVVAAIAVAGKQTPAQYRQETGTAFGTIYHITYQSDDDLREAIVRELDMIDGSLSMFNQSSTISAINRNEPYKPDTAFQQVFALAQEVARETDGAFDITVAPLVNAWGFGFKNDAPPSPADVDSLLQFVGFESVRMVNGVVQKTDPRTMIDLSAIAKGYAVDAVAAMLTRNGIENYMVEIGGEVATRGISPRRLPWKIGVTRPKDDPTDAAGEIEAVINVTDKSMATSGNYRNFYYRDGQKYAHTIDPHTGYPVEHNLLSATVVADDCATADAYATAFMVMGMQRAQQTLDRHPELMAYFIYTDTAGNYQEWFSPTMADKIED